VPVCSAVSVLLICCVEGTILSAINEHQAGGMKNLKGKQIHVFQTREHQSALPVHEGQN